ncbi:hypothetical protein C8R45DRAFT_1144038 [Mycena sanguinolenta]|nr:hypothetical protein C8R45DRAFT_1144038 [Mycena sanguinolenta]
MSEATHPAKRQRTEDSGDAGDATTVRSKIWMPYGDIILQAESTQFRVNRDLLAQQSSVFKDMFSLPQPADEPTVEGCPIVRVSDTAKDWELLLEVLYYHPFQAPPSRPFDVVAAMLRLGKKYDVPEARDDALSRLHHEFPCHLDAYTLRTHGSLTKITPRSGILVDLLRLLYECSEELFNGAQRRDGSRIILSSSIKLTVALALEKLLFFQRNTLGGLTFNDAVIPHQTCQMIMACKQQKLVMIQSATTNFRSTHDVTCNTVGRWPDGWAGKLCNVCEAAAKEYYEANRQKCWELLPTFFGLSGWKDMEDFSFLE